MNDESSVEGTEGGEIRVAYCSACDREVRLRVPELTDSDKDGGPAGEASHLTGVCLDVGEDCTGAFCPFGDQPLAEEV